MAGGSEKDQRAIQVLFLMVRVIVATGLAEGGAVGGALLSPLGEAVVSLFSE